MEGAGPVVVDDPTAVMGRRILAYLIDLVVSLAIAGLIGAALFMAISAEGSYATPPPGVHADAAAPGGCDQDREIVQRVPRQRRPGQFASDDHVRVTGRPAFCVDFGGGSVRYIEDGAGFDGWVVVSLVTGSAVNLVVLQGLTGASLAKWILGLLVVYQDGSRIRLGMATWRWFLLAFDSMCCVFPGLLLALTKPGHQRLGDLGAQSYVVRRSAAGTPLPVVGAGR